MNYKTFSLILATVGRKREVREFLESLELSNYPLEKVEIIIIDQNKNDLIKEIIKDYTKKLKIIYIKSQEKGLSKNRNIGLKYISNEIIGFPDDDCKYFPETLLKVSHNFNTNLNIDAIIGRLVDEEGKDCIRRWGKKEMKVTKTNFYTKTSSVTIFEKNKSILRFDEELGAGSKYGSSEDVDFLYRLLKLGKKIYYNPDIIVYHPKPKNSFTKEKAYSYGVGHGTFVKKNLDMYVIDIYIKGIVFTILRIIKNIILFDKENLILYFSSLKGRIEGIKKVVRERENDKFN